MPIIVIGTSMGGIEALGNVLSQLPVDFPSPLFAVMHLHPHSPSMLDRMLAGKTPLSVKFAEDGAVPQPGTLYLAPPDRHLLIEKKHMVLSRGPRENRFRPAIDPLFRSAAVAHTSQVIGIVLTGLLDDGAAGLQAIKQCGGIAIVQDPRDAAFPEMPRSAMEAVQVDHCVKLSDMGALLAKLVAAPAKQTIQAPERLKKEVNLAKGLIHPDIEENIMGTAVPLICPDCGGGMNDITEGKLVRYRCHEGHAFTEHSLVDAQWEKVEYSMWTAIRTMEEQANMLQKMAHRSPRAEGTGSGYEARAVELTAHAARLKDYVLRSTGKNE
jgi:two-component system, chemotaxis family, protein-glutamate methylesterase/glutaminase